MVSFWPFKGDTTSAASFEKVLSQLSGKINKESLKNDGFRQHQRRYKALWTLYSAFAYILVVIILILVIGFDKWNALEYTGIAGGPLLIYGVRTALDAWYNYRISGTQAHLNDLNKQREDAIRKLKAATKYDSTQQLLDKYGGSPPQRKPSSSPGPGGKRKSTGPQSKQGTPQGGRTGFVPPPTANIAPPPTANIPGRQPPRSMTPQATPGSAQRANDSLAPQAAPTEPSEDFAPNAFAAPPRPPALRQASSQYANEGPKWYDRIFDVILGEDETAAKNRIALICQNCKLVNGQAPPGARTLEDIGKWRCSSCHAMNGVESEASKALQHAEAAGVQIRSPTSPAAPKSQISAPETTENREVEDDETGVFERVEESEDVESDESVSQPEHTPPAASTRSKARQKKKA